jgi:hypothetical protein
VTDPHRGRRPRVPVGKNDRTLEHVRSRGQPADADVLCRLSAEPPGGAVQVTVQIREQAGSRSKIAALLSRTATVAALVWTVEPDR